MHTCIDIQPLMLLPWISFALNLNIQHLMTEMIHLTKMCHRAASTGGFMEFYFMNSEMVLQRCWHGGLGAVCFTFVTFLSTCVRGRSRESDGRSDISGSDGNRADLFWHTRTQFSVTVEVFCPPTFLLCVNSCLMMSLCRFISYMYYCQRYK